MWGPKREKVRKPWVLRLKRWSLSMCLMKSGDSGKDTIEKKILHLSYMSFFFFKFAFL